MDRDHSLNTWPCGDEIPRGERLHSYAEAFYYSHLAFQKPFVVCQWEKSIDRSKGTKSKEKHYHLFKTLFDYVKEMPAGQSRKNVPCASATEHQSFACTQDEQVAWCRVLVLMKGRRNGLRMDKECVSREAWEAGKASRVQMQAHRLQHHGQCPNHLILAFPFYKAVLQCLVLLGPEGQCTILVCPSLLLCMFAYWKAAEHQPSTYVRICPPRFWGTFPDAKHELLRLKDITNMLIPC